MSEIDDIVSRHVEKPPRMIHITGGADYSGGATEKLIKLEKDLNNAGYQTGTDCGSLRENGTAILYVWEKS